MTKLPPDYAERVYAGVLGKIIGVYLGRPFEGWSHERIIEQLGDIEYYVNDRLGAPLVVADDDISGMFAFLRALSDNGNPRDLDAALIGNAWLNYLIEYRTILWWGGLGRSTEHTAFLRLKAGIPAPLSGSIAMNSQVIAEQIGAQIFIDGWAMVAPGDPELAADLAGRASSVSHDGAAIHGAQVVAAMEALAFVEPDLNRLFDVAVGLIPPDSTITRLIADVREWHASGDDWRATFRKVQQRYGYDKFLGACHMVPNHAVIVLSLLHGDDDFQRALMIANTCGWDTDCNAGNVGCLLGIKNGLAGIAAGPDWRGPVADRLYVVTADGGSAISDAVRESLAVVNIGRTLAGEAPVAPKDGARFHFSFPGSVQGFHADATADSLGTATIENVSRDGARSLALRYRHLAPGRIARATTPTFIPPGELGWSSYDLLACPTLYPGQHIRAAITADAGNPSPVNCRLVLRHYDAGDQLTILPGPSAPMTAGERREIAWRAPDTGGQPIAEVGLEVASAVPTDGSVYLEWLTWDGAPDTTFDRPTSGGSGWSRAWVNGVDQVEFSGDSAYRLIQNAGTGLLIQGTRDWRDYNVSTTAYPEMFAAGGIAARVQGMRRYYALLLIPDNRIQLVKMRATQEILAETECDWSFWQPVDLALEVRGERLVGKACGRVIFDVTDLDEPLESGALALICCEGTFTAGPVRVQPA